MSPVTLRIIMPARNLQIACRSMHSTFIASSHENATSVLRTAEKEKFIVYFL